MIDEPLQRPLVTVHLHGPLADRFGATHAFAIRTPREALAALDANYPGFTPEFLKQQHYYVIADGDQRGGDDAVYTPVWRDLHFYPRVEGQGPLLAPLVSFIIPGISAAAASLIGSVVFAGLMLGLSLLLKPTQPEKPKDEGDKKDESYAFSGPENVTEQGVAVPLIYGRCWVGSVVVSAGLSVSDEEIPA